MTKEYVQAIGRMAYIWGWPLVNNYNRSLALAKLPGPGRNGGILPVSPPGAISMLTDYLKAYQKLDQFQGNSKFYTWIVRIAVNESLMKLRKRKGNRFVSLDEPIETGEEEVKREIAVWEDNPEQRYSREEMQAILNEAVDELKPDFRTVFTLRDIEELSTEDTAEALGISVPAVKSRLLRARLALREKLTRQFRRKGDDILGHL